MADINAVRRVDEGIREGWAEQMQTVEIGKDGLLLTMDGRPIMVIKPNIDYNDDSVDIIITVHKKVYKHNTMPHRRMGMTITSRSGWKCSATGRNIPYCFTYDTFTSEEAAQTFQEEMKERYNLDVPLDTIQVIEEKVEY